AVPNGKVLVAGGLEAGGPGKSSEIWDPGAASATPASFKISAPVNATAAVAFSFTVTAYDQANNVTPFNGLVHFTSTDGSASLPANSALSGGTGTFSATFVTAGSQTL